MSRLSPLLSGVLAVEEGKVKVTLTPEKLTLPADAYGIRVAPLRCYYSRTCFLVSQLSKLNASRDACIVSSYTLSEVGRLWRGPANCGPS